MLFVIYAMDRPGDGSLRQTHRPAHIEYLKSKVAMIRTAGPLLDEDGEKMVGSMLVVEAANLAAAKAFAAADPFAKNGVFASVAVRPWRASVGSVSFA